MKNVFSMIALSLILVSVHSAQAKSKNAVEPDALCAKYKDLEPPLKDLPSDKDSERLKDCSSNALYYGMGVAVNDHDARVCAFNDPTDPEDSFSGSAILMMIYANGRGVPKNIPLAKHYACELVGATAEHESRLEHLDQLTKSHEKFDVCDDATSGMLGGICESHRQDLLDYSRKEKLAKIVAQFSESQKKSFEILKKASDSFTDSRSDLEVDQGGTLRGAFVAGEAGVQRDDFLQSLQLLEAKKSTHYTAAEFKSEDEKLNKIYGQLKVIYEACEAKAKAAKNEDSFFFCTSPGAVGWNGIRTTQLAWLKYRDAWAGFAKLRYPAYADPSVAAWFTKKRSHMLQSLLTTAQSLSR